jgi:hypothetical protein
MFIRTFLVSLFLTSTILAQAKVGTTGAQFLELTPSVRSLGMGEVGAALSDHQSAYSNPATLGLSGDYTLSFSFRPLQTDLGYSGSDVNYQYLNLSSKVATFSNGWSMHAGLLWGHLGNGSMIEWTYQEGTYEGTGREFTATDNTYGVTVALSKSSPLSFGFGGTVRYVEENSNDYSADGVAFDLGGVVRIPLSETVENNGNSNPRTSLTAGASLKNWGPDLKLVDKEYPLPSAFRFGLALETHLSDFSFTVAVEEKTSTKLKEGEASIGLESGLRDAIWLRIGSAGNSYQDNLTTFGASVSVRGFLTRIISPSGQASSGQGRFHRLDLIASYASSVEDDQAFGSGVDYFQLELVL